MYNKQKDTWQLSLTTVRGLRTYAAEDFGCQVLVKLPDDDSNIVVLKEDLNGKYEKYDMNVKHIIENGLFL